MAGKPHFTAKNRYIMSMLESRNLGIYMSTKLGYREMPRWMTMRLKAGAAFIARLEAQERQRRLGG